MCHDAAVAVYVAFLRGINVGRNKQVAMADLQRVVEGVGHGAVGRTCGAATSCSPRTAGDEGKLGPASNGRSGRSSTWTRVIVRSARSSTRSSRPTRSPRRSRRRPTCTSCSSTASRTARSCDAFDHAAVAPDEVRFAGREIYVWYRNGMAGSKLGDNPWRRVGATSTDRNWNTVTRLAALAAEA